MSDWIPAKEKLPDKIMDVFIVMKNRSGLISAGVGYYANGKWVRKGNDEVVYWMPIPRIPER